jgi:hypothetical protein
VLELGTGQERDVAELLASEGLAIAATRHDLSGITRAIAARKS